MFPTQLTGLRSQWPTALFLVGLAAIWIFIGQTWLFVGPSEWDDVLYVEIASLPTPMAEVRNRYVHIWLLRIFQHIFDSRAFASGLYANVIVVLAAALCFGFGRAAAGISCGVIAALIMPLNLAFLKWITVPYVDPCMALWSGCAVFAAAAGTRVAHPHSRIGWLVFAGFCTYFAIKSKETGIAVIPIVLLIILHHQKKHYSASLVAGGFLVGWLTLVCLDAAFTDSTWPWRSSDWGIYLGVPSEPPKATPIPHIIRMHANYVEQLIRAGHLGVTLLATAGAIRGFRNNLFIRASSLWWCASLLFGSVIAVYRIGLFADERYLAAFAPAMTVLAAFEIVSLYRNARSKYWKEGILAIVVVAGAVCLPIGYLLLDITNSATERTSRAIFFMLPVGILISFTTAEIIKNRIAVTFTLIALGSLTAISNLNESRHHVLASRARIEPWKKVAALTDDAHVSLIRWRLPDRPLPKYQVRRRLRVLSKRPLAQVIVTNEQNLPHSNDKKWVFALGQHDGRLEKLHWIQVAQGLDGVWWSVYRPPM